MFFRILIKYILGYINIKIEGYFVEKFINKCINENIFFWNVKREKSTIVYINTGIKDFKRLCRIARECKCKRSEEHTSELQSRQYLVCRLLLEKNFFNDTATTEIYTLSLHDALPISCLL